MAMSAAAIRFLIEKKRRGAEHSSAEIAALLRGFMSGEVAEGPMAAWLMAVCFAGMSVEETAALTLAMAHSAAVITWPQPELVVDKHSSGGVGDAISLIAVPLAAACGVKVAKLSGRALGHTGGTIDKLECIPGLRTDLSMHEFKSQVMEAGCAIASASAELAPADKLLYALRDRTGTVDSIPLIAASIMSKKIAGGAGGIVLDVKVGGGAFMRSIEEARRLATTMVEVGARLGRHVRALLTDMDAPLADSIGDALELDEALGVLEGRANTRLGEAACLVASAMLAAAGHTQKESDAAPRAALAQQAAAAKFREMVIAQHGRLNDFDRRFEASNSIKAVRNGFVQRIDARALAEFVAGAKSSAGPGQAARLGIRLRKHVGDAVDEGAVLLETFGERRAAHKDPGELSKAFAIGSHAPSAQPLLLGELSS